MKKKSKKILIVSTCILLLFGCSSALSNEDKQNDVGNSYAASASTPSPANTPTLEPTTTPTPAPTITPTLEPTPTETSSPTLTPEPAPTEISTPSSTPTPEPTLAPTAPPQTETTSAPTVADNTKNTGNESNFNTYNNTEQQDTEDTWVLNTNSKKIHYPHCKSVPKIAPQNYSTSSESLNELQNRGYTTCGNCFK